MSDPCRVVREWNSTPAERAADWPCDRLLAGADAALFRAVDAAAPASALFRRVCQLRVAPYSYDWVDNRGRRSPRELVPGLEELAVGQRFMQIFVLADFATDDHVTLRSTNGLFGDVALSYRVRATDASHSRLTVKVLVRHRRDLLGRLWMIALPAGDLVMMRKQLYTLTRLAEADARANEEQRTHLS